ncbi:aminodeoxychorismate/anthranilate synthase component II [Kordiimonas sp. SCSIO 12610]|uniref:anthranilate synthase component II n=1 Tax=Kordiimonas sp. SCSIO 12610 TaxID=2829597 RepID=UPI00210B02D2|nr:aminodeoxychorismate/anthranilate synthase component II [Kordiimonas sp. SCSIO 12610]UTW54038.1 aminodeoxychorismate/anthranilate synthase component II [Kordiimonas sp. SCSIO 12610]
MYILIDNYDSFTYNLYHYFVELGADVKVWRNDQITVEDVIKLKPQGIILSPGPCTPNEAGICLDMIAAAKENHIPLLGVCLGHQAIGQHYGGDVVRAPYVMHGKTSDITHNQSGVFTDIPETYTATRYHSLVVDKETLPAELTITAETEDGLIMGLENKADNMYGVQFHPESIASDYGHALLKNFIDICEMSAA